MKMNSVSVLVGLLLSASLVTSTVAPLVFADSAKPIPVPGRYQMTLTLNGSNDLMMFICDTSTGRCWRRDKIKDKIEWFDFGSPEDKD